MASSLRDPLILHEESEEFSNPFSGADNESQASSSTVVVNTPTTAITPKAFSGKFSPVGAYKRCWYGFLFFSIFLMILLPLIVNWKIKQGVIEQVVMDSTHAMGYPMFRNRTSQGGTTMEYTFFNITNPHEVLAGKERPHLEEIGPFIYLQTQVRDDLVFDYDQDLLSFRQQIYQTFDPHATREATKGRFDHDRVVFCSINLLFLGMKSVVGQEAWHLINEVTLWNTDFKRLFEFRTVHDLIEGYSVPLDIGGIKIPISFPGLVPSYRRPMDDPEYRFPNKIYMGKKDLKRTNSLKEWGPGKTESLVPCPWGNNPLSLDCTKYKNNPCCGFNLKVKPWGTQLYPELWNANANLVQGTLGDAFRPFLSRSENEKVIVWSDQLARALQFSNKHKRAVNHHGIQLFRFSATDEFWANATVHPPNARFYQFGPNGLVNASMIYLGTPIFASLPHFLRCESTLQSGVTGLNPNEELHDMFLDVEPTTGMTFREHNRIQINAQILGRETFLLGKKTWFPHVKDCFVPIGYFDAHSEINHVGVKEFLALYDGMSYLWGAFAFGVVCLTLSLIGSPVYYWFKSHHKKQLSKNNALRQRGLDQVMIVEDEE